MKSEVAVTFRVPQKAFEVLMMLEQQNYLLKFDLDRENRAVTLSADLLDFSDFADDWDSLEDIEISLSEVE